MRFPYFIILFFSFSLAGINSLYSQEIESYILPVDGEGNSVYDSLFFEDQVPPNAIQKIDREKYLKDEKFKYNPKNDVGNIDFKNPLELFFERLFKNNRPESLDNFANIVKGVLIGLFLILLFYFIYSNGYLKFGKRNKNLANDSGIIWEELNLDPDILNKRIQDLLKEHNYNEAFRLNYIRILQILEKNKLIKIRPEKTNYDYLNDLKSQDIKGLFNSITVLFDYAIYGDFNIGIEQYKRGESFINKLENLIQVNK